MTQCFTTLNSAFTKITILRTFGSTLSSKLDGKFTCSKLAKYKLFYKFSAGRLEVQIRQITNFLVSWCLEGKTSVKNSTVTWTCYWIGFRLVFEFLLSDWSDESESLASDWLNFKTVSRQWTSWIERSWIWNCSTNTNEHKTEHITWQICFTGGQIFWWFRRYRWR